MWRGNRLKWVKVVIKMARLKEIYKKESIPTMVKKFGYKNELEVPKIEKVCVNAGVSNAKNEPKLLEQAKKKTLL